MVLSILSRIRSYLCLYFCGRGWCQNRAFTLFCPLLFVSWIAFIDLPWNGPWVSVRPFVCPPLCLSIQLCVRLVRAIRKYSFIWNKQISAHRREKSEYRAEWVGARSQGQSVSNSERIREKAWRLTLGARCRGLTAIGVAVRLCAVSCVL